MICGVLSSVHIVFPSNLGSGLCMVAFGCVVSRSVEGAALGLHIFCGTCSCVFGFVGGVSISCCACEPCLVGVVFDVALRVGVI